MPILKSTGGKKGPRKKGKTRIERYSIGLDQDRLDYAEKRAHMLSCTVGCYIRWLIDRDLESMRGVTLPEVKPLEVTELLPQLKKAE
jgi:hypothetical protein